MFFHALANEARKENLKSRQQIRREIGVCFLFFKVLFFKIKFLYSKLIFLYFYINIKNNF